jgi:hypothetical protein
MLYLTREGQFYGKNVFCELVRLCKETLKITQTENVIKVTLFTQLYNASRFISIRIYRQNICKNYD